jgi:hypothetical protein
LLIRQQVRLPAAVEKGPGLLPEPLNDVAIVDGPSATLALSCDAHPGQFHHLLSSQVANDAVVVEVQLQLAAYQPGGHCVKDAANINGTAGADASSQHFIVGHSVFR